jgi:hypothetical protein
MTRRHRPDPLQNSGRGGIVPPMVGDPLTQLGMIHGVLADPLVIIGLTGPDPAGPRSTATWPG